MFTKQSWEELTFEIKWYKKHKNSTFFSCKSREYLFIWFLILTITTPILILIDISLLPLEIMHYFFCKWLEKVE